MRPSYNAPEAPTHLRASDLPPGLLDDTDPPTGASRGGYSISSSKTRKRDEEAPIHLDVEQPSVFARPARRGTEPGSVVPLPDPPAVSRKVQSTPRSGVEHADAPRSSRSNRDDRPRTSDAPRSSRSSRDAAPSSDAPRSSRSDRPRSDAAAPRSSSQPSAHASVASQPSASRGSQPSASASASASRGSQPSASASASRGSQPSVPSQPARGSEPQLPAGLGALDPLAIPTPPELAGAIYGHIRRLALQADLKGADRVLRDALAELTSSLSVAVVYPGQDGLWTLGPDDEIPKDAQPLVAVAQARRALIATHTALVPIVTTTETVGVIMLTRNQRQPAYSPVEQVAMVALAREAAPILHHLAVQHLQRQTEIKADKGSLYRGEALEAHRTKGQEGSVVELSPTWVKRTYPVLVLGMLVAIVFAVLVHVPTYSSGPALIRYDGTPVTAPAAGTVAQRLVEPGTPVKKGQPLLRLQSADEDAQLTASEAEWHDNVVQFLFDQSDEQVRKQLASATTQRDHARAKREARVVRAPRDGVVSDIRVTDGKPLNAGDHILTIVDEGSMPEVIAFLPGKDRPRLREGMEIQIDLTGYTKVREKAKITSIGNEIIGGNEAAKLLGATIADSFKDLQAGSFVVVRARLLSNEFKTEHRTYHYHDGMEAKTEVLVQNKPFIVTLLPALEKYIPD